MSDYSDLPKEASCSHGDLWKRAPRVHSEAALEEPLGEHHAGFSIADVRVPP